MQRLSSSSPNLAQSTRDALMELLNEPALRERLAQACPAAYCDGELKLDLLMEEMGKYADLGDEERYEFRWNGKQRAKQLAQTPSTCTLRPCPEESKNWDTTQNLYIEGDNLEVLKILQRAYSGKIKMIYIDPPYNTGHDFVYKDDFSDSLTNYLKQTGAVGDDGKLKSSNTAADGRYHTNWLNMMYPRLRLAKNLLTKDGVIFISIDDNEQANLKKLCDEVFGGENFVGNIVVENDSRVRPYESLAITHEYLMAYKKNQESSLNQLFDKDKKFKFYDTKGGFDLYELRNRNSDFNINNRPNLYYPFWVNPNSKDEFGLYELSLEEKDGWIKFYPQESQGIKTVWRWGKEKSLENLNIEIFGKKATGGWQVVKKYRDAAYSLNSVWEGSDFLSDKGTLDFKELFDKKRIFAFPKPINLLKRCLELSSSPDSIILDFFSGSATTAHAVMQLNAEDGGKRKFIMVQLPEVCDAKSEAAKAGYKNICEIGKERIRRAGEKVVSDQLSAVSSGKPSAGSSQRAVFGDQQSAGSSQRAVFGDQQSAGGGQRAVFGDQQSAGSSQRAVFGDQQSAGGGQRSVFGDQSTDNCSLTTDNLDIGFKVFKLADSNMNKWKLELADLSNKSDVEKLTIANIMAATNTIRRKEIEAENEQRREAGLAPFDIDLCVVYEWLLKYGVQLDKRVEVATVAGKRVYLVSGGAFMICLDDGLDQNWAQALVAERDKRIGSLGASTISDMWHVMVADASFTANDLLNVEHYLTSNGLKGEHFIVV